MSGERPRLVCLLPARNCESDLPGWFESVEGLVDAVVALDDGSTDATAELLERHPLVQRLLRNPRRDSYAGWDDSANRNRLLEAAAELEPDWILSLDADERIDPEDAAALREFLRSDALPGCAYGFRHYRAWAGDRHDPRFSYVYRLFAHRPGARFPNQQLHFNPVPTDVQRGAWIRTTLRLRHLGAMDEERLEQRLRKYRQADPERRWPTDHGRLADHPRAELPAWPRRDPGMPVLLPPGGREWPAESRRGGERPRLVCLLPARNCESDLPGWFESVEGLVDAVVALDDGSTDATAELLERHPLVQRLLRNPRRDSYAGWDDSANRNRLLEAAAELEPDWILSLDADERIDPEDAAALREFLGEDPPRDAAYGFRVYRMVGDRGHYDRATLWAYRLFAYAPGQVFGEERLHLLPVPSSIDRRKFVRTTVRIQHLAGIDERHRRARYAKYAQADPGREHQRSYENLLARPGRAHPWSRRPAGLPVLADGWPGRDAGALDLDGPALSAIVVSRNDQDRIEGVVRAVVEQDCPEPFEVIVVVSGDDRTADIVRELFPEVILVELQGRAYPGRARNAGLRVARGEFVSFPGSHVELPQGSLAARLRAHREGHAMVTGTMRNGTPTAAGWASYFLDHSSVLPGRPSEPLTGPPAHCSYIRDHLERLGGFPEDLRAGEDTVVNVALHRRGIRAFRARDVSLTHRSRCTSVRRLLVHHFQRGRGMGRILIDEHLDRGALPRALAGPFGRRYLARRLGATSANVGAWGGDLLPVYRRVYALVVAAACAALAGIWFEALRPQRGKGGRLVAGLRRRRAAAAAPRGAAAERFPGPLELNAYVVPGKLARDPSVAAEVEETARSLTYASVFGHRFDAAGALLEAPDAAALEVSVRAGAEPLLVLSNIADGGFNTALASALLDSPAAQERLLEEVERMCAERGYAGLSLDFERVAPADRDRYTDLAERAAERMHAANRLLAVALAPKESAGQPGPWHAGHDYPALGQAADLAVVMAYEWRWGGLRGPVAPLPGVRRVLEYAVSEIDRDRLLLGMPLYGYEWIEAGSGWERRSVGIERAARLASEQAAEAGYDERLETAFCRFVDRAGARHEVWYEDERALAAKLDLVRAFGLRGASLWRVPGDAGPALRVAARLFALRLPVSGGDGAASPGAGDSSGSPRRRRLARSR